MVPVQSDDTIFLIQKDGSTPTSCAGNMGLVLAQNFTDLCDVDIVNATNGQIVQYNGSHWVNIDDSVINSITSNNNDTIGVAPTTGNVVLYPKYELLCQANWVSGSSFSCSNFDARTYLLVKINGAHNNNLTMVMGIQFNGDTGNNYSYRLSTNGAADVTTTSSSRCAIQTTSDNEGGGFVTMNTFNVLTERKLSNTEFDGYQDRASTSAPTRIEGSCLWNNTSAQITTITVMRGGGSANYMTGAEITVWGYD